MKKTKEDLHRTVHSVRFWRRREKLRSFFIQLLRLTELGQQQQQQVARLDPPVRAISSALFSQINGTNPNSWNFCVAVRAEMSEVKKPPDRRS